MSAEAYYFDENTPQGPMAYAKTELARIKEEIALVKRKLVFEVEAGAHRVPLGAMNARIEDIEQEFNLIENFAQDTQPPLPGVLKIIRLD